MYIIINKTTGHTTQMHGNYPQTELDELLDAGNDIIIISLYSNTIKVPYLVVENGLRYWENKEYKLPNEMFSAVEVDNGWNWTLKVYLSNVLIDVFNLECVTYRTEILPLYETLKVKDEMNEGKELGTVKDRIQYAAQLN